MFLKMQKKSKTVKIFIAYQEKENSIYSELEPYLEELKSAKMIDSWYRRQLTGKEWDEDVHPGLEKFSIILVLISPEFIANEYCYKDEIKKAIKLQKKGQVHIIPLLVRETDIRDTSFENLKALPAKGYTIDSPYWETRAEAFKDIQKGILRAIKKINESRKDCFISKTKQPFPFCIKRFAIKNFLCIRDAELDEIPVDCQWVFITGENGDGKTALLQALAVGLLGNKDKEANHLLADNSRIQIEFKQDGENTIRELYKEKEIDDFIAITTDIKNEPVRNVLGYGVTRLNIMTSEAEKSKKDTNPAYSLYNETEGNFRNIQNWMINQYLENHSTETPMIRKIKETLKTLMPNIEKVAMEGKDIFYYEKGYKARYPQISSGSKMVVAMIGDMMIGFFTVQSQDKEISEFKGIVLIDELDLHLHPIWQKKLPKLLSDAFPHVQFWATTHSIVPFMGAPDNSVFLKVTRDEKVLTRVERLDIDVKRLLPDTLISSPLFGLEDFIRKGVNDFRSEYLYSEYQRNKEIEDQLKETAKKFKLPKCSFFDDETGGT